MRQDMNQHAEQPHLLDQVVLAALEPEFRYPDIARQYWDGEFASRLDAEIEDILHGCGGEEEAAALPLSSEALAALRELHCIALIEEGQVLPLLDIEQMATPTTALQRTHLYHAAARTLLEAIAAIYEEREQRAKRGDDDEGEPSPV